MPTVEGYRCDECGEFHEAMPFLTVTRAPSLPSGFGIIEGNTVTLCSYDCLCAWALERNVHYDAPPVETTVPPERNPAAWPGLPG